LQLVAGPRAGVSHSVQRTSSAIVLASVSWRITPRFLERFLRAPVHAPSGSASTASPQLVRGVHNISILSPAAVWKGAGADQPLTAFSPSTSAGTAKATA